MESFTESFQLQVAGKV